MATVFHLPLQVVTDYPWLVLAPVGTLALTYLAIVGVALFHPRQGRRKDARDLLDRHFFSRRRR